MASIRRRRDRNSWVVDCRDAPGGRRVVVKAREQAEFVRADMIRQSQQARPVAPERCEARGVRGTLAGAGRSERRAEDAVVVQTEPAPAHPPRVRRDEGAGDPPRPCQGAAGEKAFGGLSRNSVRLIRAALAVMLGDAVERSVEDTGRVKNLKTGKSQTVDLSARAAAVLSDLRALAEAEALAAGKDAAPEWTFVTRAGAPPRPHRLARTFRRVARPAGRPDALQPAPYMCVAPDRDARAYHLHRQPARAYKVTTTLTYCAHMFPNGDRRHMEEMERARGAAAPALMQISRTMLGSRLTGTRTDGPVLAPHANQALRAESEASDLIGGPSRTRTLDPLIKSETGSVSTPCDPVKGRPRTPRPPRETGQNHRDDDVPGDGHAVSGWSRRRRR